RLRAEIDRDGPRADVDSLSDVRVAHVAEVVHLCASADAAVLDLGVVAQRHVSVDNGTPAQVAERPDLDAFADSRAFHNRVPDPLAGTDPGIHEIGIRPDRTVAHDSRTAAQMAAGLEDRYWNHHDL